MSDARHPVAAAAASAQPTVAASPAATMTPLLDVAHRTDLATRAQRPEVDRLAQATCMGAVELRTANRRALEDFYVRGVGLSPLATEPGRTVLGLGERVVVVLVDAPHLRPAAPGSAGLFHTAIVFDSPRELARSLTRMWVRHPEAFEGPGDHLVSQAFYFHDPEGNGVELYYDRPRSTWQWGSQGVTMGTSYIDPNEFLLTHLGVSGTQRELDAAHAIAAAPRDREVSADDALAVAGQVGHVHLQVGDVETARRFYVDALGFDVTSDMGSALFVAAGGYHHHMAMNVWGTKGAGLRAPALGLGVVDILLPQASDLTATRERLASHGVQVRQDAGADRLLVGDPWGNELRLQVG
ncbi:VOC family protein [Actinomyces urogenitalis]|uniref:VOC family protein n=1 Tax=Actinomyces urogenitalis TaxID=103621 RepID=UPI00242D2227|nr:VOC family protein [Actinomyces urogenitalis]MCI7456450.1 VOC family protein [Actinomyces urogenitalis]